MKVRNIIALAACAAVIVLQTATVGAATGEVAAAPAAAPAPADSAHPLARADLETWLDGMVPYALKAGDMAGAVVVVVKDGTVLLEKGFGFADVGKKHQWIPSKPWFESGPPQNSSRGQRSCSWSSRASSISTATSTTIWTSRFPNNFGKPITLRDLMNHRGGFEEGLKDVLWTNPHGVPSTEAYLKDHQRPMLFAPGQVPAYSNYGAALAGYIVERISKEPFERYIERHILSRWA